MNLPPPTLNDAVPKANKNIVNFSLYLKESWEKDNIQLRKKYFLEWSYLPVGAATFRKLPWLIPFFFDRKILYTSRKKDLPQPVKLTLYLFHVRNYFP